MRVVGWVGGLARCCAVPRLGFESSDRLIVFCFFFVGGGWFLSGIWGDVLAFASVLIDGLGFGGGGFDWWPSEASDA